MLPGWQNLCLVGQANALKRLNMFLEKQYGKSDFSTVCSIVQLLTSCFCRSFRDLKPNLILAWHQWTPVPDIIQVVIMKTNEALWINQDWIINLRDINPYRLLFICISLGRCLRYINGRLLESGSLETFLIFKIKTTTKLIRKPKKQTKKRNSYIEEGKEISSTLFVKFQCKQVSFSFSPSTPFSLSLLSDLKGLFTTTALISFPLTHCNLAPALPIQTNSPGSQMTSFWATQGISVSSLTFLSNLIPLITFFLAWLLWQYPLVAFFYCFFSIFYSSSFSLLHGTLSKPLQNLFSHCIHFSLVFCCNSQTEHFNLSVLSVSVPFYQLNWQFSVFRMIPCQLKQRKITGKSLIWSCHSSSSAYCCWQLRHSPSAFKLRISFVILLHVPMCLDNHGRLAARPVGIREIFPV